MRWTIACLSVRYSTLPAFDSPIALATSSVTVPTFGLGILPWGPRTRPSLPTCGISAGVAIATSKSVQPLLDLLGEVGGADEVGARLLGVAGLVALGEDGDGDVLAEPGGQGEGSAQLLLGVADVDPKPAWSSTASSNLAVPLSLTSAIASAGGYWCAALDLLEVLAVALAVGHQSSLPRRRRPSSARCRR